MRPTSQPKRKAKRGRRRPDPLAAATDELRAWFDADPVSTGRQLLERLQETYPECYPDGLVRTVQRRLKVWRSEMAHARVWSCGAHIERRLAGARRADPVTPRRCAVGPSWRPPNGVVLAAIGVAEPILTKEKGPAARLCRLSIAWVRKIAAEFATLGHLNVNGRPYSAKSVRSMIEGLPGEADPT